MHQSIVIRGTGKYIPDNKVYNEFFIKHFDKMGLPAEGLMEHLGRRKRYLASEGETAITMAHEAGKDALQKNGLEASDIDMLVFVSDTPEYLMPANAVKLTHLLEAENVKMAFDLNANCSGMLLAMDIVSGYLKSNQKFNRALIIGSFNISMAAQKDDTVVYPNFGDAAAAIILEKQQSEIELGLLDSENFVDASYQKYVTYPKCGISRMALKDTEWNERKLEWNPFDMGFIPDRWTDMITRVLDRNQITSQDVDFYIFSQLSDPDNIETLRKLNIGEEKYVFLGKEYGYTGNTCTILVLDRIWPFIAKKGHKVIFCTVGSGYSAVVLLYQF